MNSISTSKPKLAANILPIHSDPQIMSGIPVFIGTRVPAQTLFDYLMDGCNTEEFLDNFPTVSSQYVSQVLQFANQRTLEGL